MPLDAGNRELVTKSGSQFLRHDLLQHLDGDRQAALLRLAYQQMNVFGHDHIAEDTQIIPAAHPLQCLLEDATRLRAAQQRSPAITTEGDEV